MSSVWLLALTAGIQDGFCPPGQMTCAVFLFLFFYLKSKALSPQKYLARFIVSSVLFNIFFGSGLMLKFMVYPAVQTGMTVFFYVLAALCFFSSALFMYHWARSKTLLAKAQEETRGSVFKVRFLVAITALVISVASAAWPMNGPFSIMLSSMAVPGKIFESILVFLLYTMAKLWMMFLVALVFLRGALTLRLQQAISAAVFLGAAVSVVYLIK